MVRTLLNYFLKSVLLYSDLKRKIHQENKRKEKKKYFDLSFCGTQMKKINKKLKIKFNSN